MPQLILPYQSSFIAGRSITDNVIIAQEIIHSMRLKKGKRGWVAVKVDLEKAFDRLRWDFIEDTLNDAGLPSNLINVIMTCISTASMQILWNGSPTEEDRPSRGVRQGDPMSPYVFVLCMERLSQAINLHVNKGHWKAIKLGRSGPLLSHLFFADDLILFGSSDDEQIDLMKFIIDEFCVSSGHKVSGSKSNIFLSRQIPTRDAFRICNKLGYQLTDNLGKYLGVPLLHSRVNKSTYAYIEEKVKQKLSGWNARNFSLAGRITLAKAVLSSIPLYTMQTSQLPASLCSKLEKITRDFIWNSTVDQHRTSLVSRKKMCRPQQFCGCGLKKLSSQNQALLMKIGFALISRPDQLWVQVLRAKYKWSPEGRVPPNVINCSA